MGIIGGTAGYQLLRKLFPRTNSPNSLPGSDEHKSLSLRFGPEVWSELQGKTVIDFGCGLGEDALEMARHARKVIGIDIQEQFLEAARKGAARAGIENVEFTAASEQKADVIVSVNSFEHFADPAAILETMAELLNAQGEILISFGPPWYHPRGGHLFSVFPWAHLVFSESALIRWRSDFKEDGARRFGEVAGGLNQITVHRFEKLVAESRLKFLSFEAVPIQAARQLHNRLTREFLTSFVRCRLGLR